MTPYVLSLLPKADVELFEGVREVILAMRDIDLGKDEKGEDMQLSCHMLARAIGKVFGLTIIDGFYAVGYQHSWNESCGGHIIDVYPPGVLGGPLLVENRCPTSPGKRLYTIDPKGFASHVPIIRTESFQRATRTVTEEALRVYREIF